MHASNFELSADKVIYREFSSIYLIILHGLHLFWYTLTSSSHVLLCKR